MPAEHEAAGDRPSQAEPEVATSKTPVETSVGSVVGAGEDPPSGTPDYDPTGLNLARTTAHSVGAQSPRGRRRKSPRRPVDPQSSGAHPDDRDPQQLGATMDRLMEERGWSREINVHVLLGRWPALVGAVNAAHSQPERYRDAILTVRAESTAWATSLRTMAPQLVARLNDQLGDGTVGRITVLGPDAPSWKRGRLSVRNGRGPRDTYG